MKKMFKVHTILALALLPALALSACSKNDNASPGTPTASVAASAASASKVDISKEVKLKMYLIGDKPKDADLVYAEVNKLLKQDINATVDAQFLSWAEWKQKYPLLFASGEDFDLIFTANWAQYTTQAGKGGFLELTKDMMNKYMPKTAASMYPEAWEQAKIGGKVLMLPYNYKEIQGIFTLLRGDLLEKYGLNANDLMKDSKSLEKYYEAFAKNEKMTSFNGGGKSWGGLPTYIPYEKMKNWMWVGGTGNYNLYYDNTQAAPKLFSIIDTDAFVEGVRVSKEWVDKGIISRNAMVNTSANTDDFINGKVPMTTNNLLTMNSTYISVNKQHPEWKVLAVDANFGNPVDLKPYTQGGMAVNHASKNPERALMMLDLFRNDQRYFNLTTYGIEGKHFKVEGNNIVPLADNASFAVDSGSPWGWREDKFYKSITGGMPKYDEFRNNMLKTAVTAKLNAFAVDDTNIKNDIAAINSVLDQYAKPLIFGVVSKSVDEDIQNLRDRLKKAGSEKLIAEIQKQIDAFLAANK